VEIYLVNIPHTRLRGDPAPLLPTEPTMRVTCIPQIEYQNLDPTGIIYANAPKPVLS
jgi:hypothetical protein